MHNLNVVPLIKPTSENVCVGGIWRSRHFWDCECDEYYIHPNGDKECKHCGVLRDEGPDSRTSEIQTRVAVNEKNMARNRPPHEYERFANA